MNQRSFFISGQGLFTTLTNLIGQLEASARLVAPCYLNKPADCIATLPAEQ